MAKYKLEYIWLDGHEPVPNLRGKTQVKEFDFFPTLDELPTWGFDGSSTPLRRGRIQPPPWVISHTTSASRGSPLVWNGLLPSPASSNSAQATTSTVAYSTVSASVWRARPEGGRAAGGTAAGGTPVDVVSGSVMR